MKRKYRKRTEPIPDAMPTIGQMVLWLVELGAYIGNPLAAHPAQSPSRAASISYCPPPARSNNSVLNERRDECVAQTGDPQGAGAEVRAEVPSVRVLGAPPESSAAGVRSTVPRCFSVAAAAKSSYRRARVRGA